MADTALPEVAVSATSPSPTSYLSSALMGVGGALLDFGLGSNSARKQRKWAERMANTQYQRAATDLEAAGLNRILALGNPGSVPGTGIVTSSGTGQTVNSARAQSMQEKLFHNQQAVMNSQVDANAANAASARQIALRDSASTESINLDNVRKELDLDFFRRIGMAPVEIESLMGATKVLSGLIPGARTIMDLFGKKGAKK